MADRYSKEATGVFDGTRPARKQNGAALGGLRRMRASYNLATDGAVTTADNILLGKLPQGAVFAYGVLTVSVTMGASAALAIGTSKTHASNGQYRAAAVATSANAPALFGIHTAQIADPLTGETSVYLTVGAADLPGAGILNVDIFFSQVD